MTETAEPYAVFCGVDVGKSDHHACALTAAGKRLYDKPLPDDETATSTKNAPTSLPTSRPAWPTTLLPRS